jgi:hypothetical protein
MAKKSTKKQSTPAAEPSAASTAPAVQTGVPQGYKVKRTITMPTLVMKDASAARILRFDSRMELSTYIDPDPKKSKEKPATVSNVTDVQTGEIFKFLVPSVVEANLRRDYDAEVKISGEGKTAKITEDKGDHKYLGLSFQIQCMGKRPGKRYRDFSIVEVEAA